MCNMYLISPEGYKNPEVGVKMIRKTGEIWVSMKDVASGINVKNISDLVLKELWGIFETKNPTKEQIKKYKMTEREIFRKFNNLSGDQLNRKSDKKVYVKNNAMTTIIKRCRDEKKRGIKAIDCFSKKLMIPDSEISECPEFEVKSKIGNIFVNEKIFEVYSVKIYEFDPYFY